MSRTYRRHAHKPYQGKSFRDGKIWNYAAASKDWDIYITRPKRQEERRLIAHVKSGDDLENISWPISAQPFEYKW